MRVENKKLYKKAHQSDTIEMFRLIAERKGEMYRYIHNLQDDIIGIVDVEGNHVLEYRYDA